MKKKWKPPKNRYGAKVPIPHSTFYLTRSVTGKKNLRRSREENLKNWNSSTCGTRLLVTWIMWIWKRKEKIPWMKLPDWNVLNRWLPNHPKPVPIWRATLIDLFSKKLVFYRIVSYVRLWWIVQTFTHCRFLTATDDVLAHQTRG